MVGSEHPDLVLVDLDLPGADPAQLLARLREVAMRELPVLVMSASDDRHTRDRAAAAGATGFIPKPFSEPSSAPRSPPSSSAARPWPSIRPEPPLWMAMTWDRRRM